MKRKQMNIIRYVLTFVISVFSVISCDVHEFPNAPETVEHVIALRFNVKNIFHWENFIEYDLAVKDKSSSVDETTGQETTDDEMMSDGRIRYTIRTFPIYKGRVTQQHTQEFVIYGNISEALDECFTLDLAEGEFQLMIWADLEIPGTEEEHYYDATDFMGILLDKHHGSTDYRDAFRGSVPVTIIPDILENEPDTITVIMDRPKAKYEFIATDLAQFIEDERERLKDEEAEEDEDTEAEEEEDDNTVIISNYRAVFYYVGFMPNAYSMFSDRQVDAITGAKFESVIDILSETEASIGFDYVFVGNDETAVTVQIGIYDIEGTQVSLTEPIKVPLMRNHHTVVRGEVMTSDYSGGVSINPDFDGEFNLIIP